MRDLVPRQLAKPVLPLALRRRVRRLTTRLPTPMIRIPPRSPMPRSVSIKIRQPAVPQRLHQIPQLRQVIPVHHTASSIGRPYRFAQSAHSFNRHQCGLQLFTSLSLGLATPLLYRSPTLIRRLQPEHTCSFRARRTTVLTTRHPPARHPAIPDSLSQLIRKLFPLRLRTPLSAHAVMLTAAAVQHVPAPAHPPMRPPVRPVLAAHRHPATLNHGLPSIPHSRHANPDGGSS